MSIKETSHFFRQNLFLRIFSFFPDNLNSFYDAFVSRSVIDSSKTVVISFVDNRPCYALRYSSFDVFLTDIHRKKVEKIAK